MINWKEAREKALKHLDSMSDQSNDIDVVLLDDATIEKDFG